MGIWSLRKNFEASQIKCSNSYIILLANCVLLCYMIHFIPPSNFLPPSFSIFFPSLYLFSTFLLSLSSFHLKNHRLFKQTILFSLLTKSFLSTHTIFGSSVHFCSLCVCVWSPENHGRLDRKGERENEEKRERERRKSEACVNITFIHCC